MTLMGVTTPSLNSLSDEIDADNFVNEISSLNTPWIVSKEAHLSILARTGKDDVQSRFPAKGEYRYAL